MIAGGIKRSLRGMLTVALAVEIPVMGVSKPLHAGFITQPEHLSYALLFFAFSLSFLIATNQRLIAYLEPKKLGGWNLYCGITLYGSLYLTAVLLCKRTNLGLLDFDLWIYIGLLLEMLGALSFLRSARRSKNSKDLKDEALWPGLVMMAGGLSLTHLAWFPLLALPGLAVMAKWLDMADSTKAEN